MEGKEHWDSSDEKAKELKISDFGTIEKVREMVKMPKPAHTFTEARNILGSLIGNPLKSAGGLTATISKNSAKEILSGKAVKNSFERQAHLLATANVEKLFFNAIEPWNFELNPEKPNDGIRTIRRLYAPMLYNGKIVPVKLTVKELKNRNEGNRLYSLRAISVDLKKIEVQVT
ncbi:MAG: hypothetical protein LBK44_00710 [Spirochaetales bacterium]|nr:hypothetical protein [Spirochaetales bacterium]